MKTLEDMLKDSTRGTKRYQELFAEQYNKVSNMLYTDYGIRSVHLSFIVRDILDRLYAGEQIVEIDRKKMIHYNGIGVVPEANSECYILLDKCQKEEIRAVYYVLGDFFIDTDGDYHNRTDIFGWRYKEREDEA